jgi:aminoglycoside phosphotransferase family enzyme
MNKRLIERILSEGIFPHSFPRRQLVETHLSYIMLGRSFAYKFKKEIKYSFLDFSTLAQRKYFCEREVMLNNRFTKGLYLGVVSVRQHGSEIRVDGTEGKIVDYAIRMKRLKDDRQMHRMLEKQQVTPKHIGDIASTLRKFHQQTTIIYKPFDLDLFSTRFNDLQSVSAFIGTALGSASATIITNAVRLSDAFLKSHQDFFKKRVDDGWVRDCHGDLHSRNIFLYAHPILFDCIEFNDEFRQIDILDELAFFCMDLEAAGFDGLSKSFMTFYFAKDTSGFGKEEQMLFTYYKAYRANVRAKVNALRAVQAEGPIRQQNLADTRKYLDLMDRYIRVDTDQ